MRDRVIIDKLAKGVSQTGFTFERDIIDQVKSGKLKDATL